MFQTLSRIGKALTEAGVGWAVGASVLLNRYNLAENPNDLDLLVCVEGAEKAAGLLAAMGETIPCVQSATYATRFFRKFRIDGTDVDMMAGFAINHPEGRYEYVFDDASVASQEETERVPVPFAALEETERVSVPFAALEETERVPVPFTALEETERVPVPFAALEEMECAPVPFAALEETERVLVPFAALEETERVLVPFAALEETERVPVPFAALEDWYVVYQLIPGKEYKAVRIEEYLLRCGIGHPYLLERALSGCLPDCVRMQIEALLARQG